MKNMRNLLAAVSFMVSIIDGSGQELKAPKNSIYFELLGSGGVYSINYERQVSSKLYGRFGMATFNSTDYWSSDTGADTRITTFPVMLTYLQGNGKNHFEIAGGMLFGLKSEENLNKKIIDLIAFIGYRYQPPDKGLLFRVGFTPFLPLDNDADYPDMGFWPWAGISLGYHF